MREPHRLALGLGLALSLSAACQRTEDPGASPEPSSRNEPSATVVEEHNAAVGPIEEQEHANVQAATCRVVTDFAMAIPRGGYLDSGPYAPPLDYSYAQLLTSEVTPYDVARVEIRHHLDPNGALMFPLTRTFTASTSPLNCDVCLMIEEDCNTGGCNKTFFAQAGALTITRADRVGSNGVVEASGANITFVEWGTLTGGPLAGGECITVPTLDFNAYWGPVVTPCIPDCTHRACGGDGCGGSCGDCPQGEACDRGACVCDPQCGSNNCGADACGASCGSCQSGLTCEDGNCCGLDGSSCAIDSHCCGGICDFTSGTCSTCRGWGSPCQANADCCTGQCFEATCVGI